MIPFRWRAAAGIVGPAAFTAAWIFGSVREEGRAGYSIRDQNISGLAAHDARHPSVMTTAFLIDGACTLMFASAVEEALGGPGRAGAGPWLIRGAGAGVLAAGIFRRDQKLLIKLDEGERQSLQNNLHDAGSTLAFASMFVTPFALARRFRSDPEWEGIALAGIVAQVASTAVLLLFQTKRVEHVNGILQRVAVSIPLLSSTALAVRLLRRGRAS